MLESLRAVCEGSNVELVAVTSQGLPDDLEKESELRAAGCQIFRDYRKMLAEVDTLDLCIIPTGIHWHTRMSLDVLSANVNVLVEKPLAGCVEDGYRIIEASKRLDRFVAVGFQDLYSTVTREIKSFLLSQQLGAVRQVQASGSWPRGRAYYERNDWAGRRQLNGWQVRDSPINNAFAHFINLSLYFAGSSDTDSFHYISKCSGKLYRSYPIETYDTVSFELIDEQGPTVSCFFTHADSHQEDPKIRIEMEHGALDWNFEKEAIATNPEGEVVARWKLPTAEQSRQDMLKNVIGSLGGGEAVLCPAAMALEHCKAIEMIESELEIEDLPVPASSSVSDDWMPRENLFPLQFYSSAASI
jgi:predicted dehydrogenase